MLLYYTYTSIFKGHSCFYITASGTDLFEWTLTWYDIVYYYWQGIELTLEFPAWWVACMALDETLYIYMWFHLVFFNIWVTVLQDVMFIAGLHTLLCGVFQIT